MSEHTEDICDLCGGSGEVEITPFGRPDDERDSFGCPACIAAERDEEIAELRQQRDKLLAALEKIAEWVDLNTMPNHPVSTFAKRAIAEGKGHR